MEASASTVHGQPINRGRRSGSDHRVPVVVASATAFTRRPATRSWWLQRVCSDVTNTSETTRASTALQLAHFQLQHVEMWRLSRQLCGSRLIGSTPRCCKHTVRFTTGPAPLARRVRVSPHAPTLAPRLAQRGWSPAFSRLCAATTRARLVHTSAAQLQRRVVVYRGSGGGPRQPGLFEKLVALAVIGVVGVVVVSVGAFVLVFVAVGVVGTLLYVRFFPVRDPMLRAVKSFMMAQQLQKQVWLAGHGATVWFAASVVDRGSCAWYLELCVPTCATQQAQKKMSRALDDAGARIRDQAGRLMLRHDHVLAEYGAIQKMSPLEMISVVAKDQPHEPVDASLGGVQLVRAGALPWI